MVYTNSKTNCGIDGGIYTSIEGIEGCFGGANRCGDREVNEHLLDDKYTTADLVAKFILEAAESGVIEEGNCLNQLSKETLKSFIGLKVETLRLGFPHYWDIGEEYRPQIEAKAASEASLVSSDCET